jgi:hypothetical protein
LFNILHLLVYIGNKAKFWRKRSRRRAFVFVGTRLVKWQFEKSVRCVVSLLLNILMLIQSTPDFCYRTWDNSRGPLTRIIRTQHFYCGFPGLRDPLTDAVAKDDLNKVRSCYRQSNLKYCVLYYLIERKKYVIEDSKICADRFFLDTR